MKEVNRHGMKSQPPSRPESPSLSIAVTVLMVGIALASLSLIEFAFPRVKWFTTPAMVVAIVLLVAVGLFRRMTWFIRFSQWVISSLRGTRTKEETLKSLGLPE